MLKKGDVVKINALARITKTYYSDKTIRRDIATFNVQDITGVVLGYSFLKTGTIKPARYYDDVNYLDIDKCHKVYVVEPIEQYTTYWTKEKQNNRIKTNRYLKPIRCFEDDLELIESEN